MVIRISVNLRNRHAFWKKCNPKYECKFLDRFLTNAQVPLWGDVRAVQVMCAAPLLEIRHSVDCVGILQHLTCTRVSRAHSVRASRVRGHQGATACTSLPIGVWRKGHRTTAPPVRHNACNSHGPYFMIHLPHGNGTFHFHDV